MKKTRSEVQKSTLGVALPARDEQARIGACLASLEPFGAAGDPLVVVDAASTDDTARIAARHGAELLRSTDPRRGLALALGYSALAPRVDVVLLAHADMVFPPQARDRIGEALSSHPSAVGGALGHRIDDPRRRFRWVERGNRLRARRWQLPYGDQAQFVRVDAVEAAGGFPRLPAMEDLELALRLRERGPLLYLDCPVLIPGRHWQHGVARVTLRNWIRALRYRLRREAAGRHGAAGTRARSDRA